MRFIRKIYSEITTCRNYSNRQESFKEHLGKQLLQIKSGGTYKTERIITSPQSTTITIEGSKSQILNFCANNYLGLCNNKSVIESGKQFLDKYGAGVSSVRFICGTQNIHKELERNISKFHNREDTILYASCFDANAGLFETILSPEDAIFSDELNHASIIDGIRLCKAKKFRYKHCDMNQITTYRNYSNRQESFKEHLGKQLLQIKSGGTYKTERIITSPQSTTITIEGSKSQILNFCANNYLGLCNNKSVIESGKQFLDKYGAGVSSVRFICGTQNIHKELERNISKFHNREDTILYASCFDANAGLFETILSPEDAIFSDELNHASIIDGIRLCKAKKFRYKHCDMNHLESMLAESDAKIKLIATDGVFSMDGNIAPLSEICNLANKYNALVFLDECHATGFFGNTGRGTEEYFGMMNQVDIINSTLGKALGGAAGGYTTGSKELVDLLRQRSRPYLFSNSLPPPVVGTALKVMEMLLSSNNLQNKIRANTTHFRNAMIKSGFTVTGRDHPICSIMLGDARLASTFADEMLRKNIYVIGFSYPVVPKEKARIRVQISAAHSAEDIDNCIQGFVEVGKKLNVI